MRCAFGILLLFNSTFAVAAEENCGELLDVIDALVAHNECSSRTDCAAMQLPPPYGCNTPVNKMYVADLGEAVAEYERRCARLLYTCIRPATSIACRRGVCEISGLSTRPLPSNTTVDQNGQPMK